MRGFSHYQIELLQPQESEAFFGLIDRNRSHLEDFFAGTVSKTKTLQDALVYCEDIQQKIKNRSYFPYMVTDTTTNRFVGLVDVKHIDWNIPKAELGYFVDEEYSRKGIASKSVGLVIDILLESYGFKKLLCRIGSTNLASRQVAINNGFVLEGTIRNDYRTTKGKIVDLDYYGRVH